MNLMQIDYFVEVVKQLNFTVAAKNLYISQPALSKQIVLLEEELGVCLLERNKRCVKLTQAGKVFYEECEKLQYQINRMINKVQCIGGIHSGSIKIGILETVNDNFFKDIFYRFKEECSECHIEFDKCNFKELRDGLEHGVFDMIFTLSFEVSLLTNVLYKVVKRHSGYIMISNSHVLAQKDILTLQDVQDIPFLIIDNDNSPTASSTVYDMCKKNNFMPVKIIKVPNIDTLLTYTELGMGFCILDKSILENQNKNIKYYEIPNDKDSFSVIAIWKKENRNIPLSLLLNSIDHYSFKL